ncbi:MAG: metallophosphoesterase [Candidatus Lernaella stagnicola]|nr:metallophosphoesterase [Candidatus Lernaella stagnicola]
MRLLVVADLHGAYDRLAAALRPDDILISLGDHLNVLDYSNLSGLLADFIPRDVIESTLELIQTDQLDEARAAMMTAAGSVPDLFAKIRRAAQMAYFSMAAAIPCEAYFIYGNVDFPHALQQNLLDRHTFVEADTVQIEGRSFGLVSGHPPGPYSFGMAGEVGREEYAQRLHEMGDCEVLCAHPPPAIPGLTFDVEAGRDEGGSPDLLYFARLHRPRLVLFGHVHQPKLDEFIDKDDSDEPVRFLNVGCFRDTGRLLEIDPQSLDTQWLNAD